MVSLVVSLLTAEIIIRIIDFQPKGRTGVRNAQRTSSIPGVFFELRPNNEFEWIYGKKSFWGEDYNIPVKVNSLGFRDEELLIPKPAGFLRILAIGDSFTLGMGVEAEEVYVEQLEVILNEQSGGDSDIEVINAGVGGYDTNQELAFFKARGAALEPDMVILGFYVNDVIEKKKLTVDHRGLLTERETGAREQKYRDLLYDPEEERSWLEYVVEESHLIRWLSRRKTADQDQLVQVSPGKRNRERTASALLEFKEIIDKMGIPLLVLVFPTLEDLPENSFDVMDYHWAVEFCRDNGMATLPMADAVKEIPWNELWAHPRDHHPGPVAHRLFADMISRHIDVDDGELTLKMET